MTWHLFVIDPKKHEEVTVFASNLSGISDVVYKLIKSTKVTKSGKKSTKQVAVFPGYLFIEADKDEDDFVKMKLMEHPFVRRYVGSLSNGDIEHLYKIREDDKYSKRFTDTFTEGDIVKVVTGLFKNYEAIVISVKQKEILIETDLNGKKVKYAAKPEEISLVRRDVI